MSKILVLGRTMDMGGTEVAMAALLQKLVEKKEDVTLLLVEKSRIRLWNGLWENGRHRQNGLSMPEEWAYF